MYIYIYIYILVSSVNMRYNQLLYCIMDYIIDMMFVLDVKIFTTLNREIFDETMIYIFNVIPTGTGFTSCISFVLKSPSAYNRCLIIFNPFFEMEEPLILFILNIIRNITEHDNFTNSTDYTTINYPGN